MRKGGKILGTILNELKKMLAPGISTMDLEKKAESMFREFGVKPSFKGYSGYPYILCTSINNNVVHTFPSENHILHNGDIINVDCGVIYNNLHTDSAFTETIGNAGKNTEKFKKVAYEALYRGIDQAKVGNRVGAIGSTVQEIVENAGYSIIKELVGHGVGVNLHEEPQIPNHGEKNEGPLLQENMTIAIEPIISMGNGGIKTLDDHWSIVTLDGALACQAEHTVLINKDGPEILTKV